jgi:hypothetical protein
MNNDDIAENFGIGYTVVGQATPRMKTEMNNDPGLRKTVSEIKGELDEK